MSIFSIFKGKPAPTYPTDVVMDKEENPVTFTFFKHASFAIQIGERHIYNDPVLQYAEYARLPKADLVLVTHSHYDHLDRAAIDDVTTTKSLIICDQTSAEVFDGEAIAMKPGIKAQPWEGLIVEAVAAYNTTEGHTDFHPKAREDCGYVLELGTGLRIYIAGDTELTPEMCALKDIDVALLPVNQPYTMTVDQAIEAIKAIRPKIFYPYHYGEVEEVTDIERLKRELEGVTDVRVFPME
ncbi:MAG: MBL fold metallo-hydrolase [Alistipes sp.]|nr:MBL fold metallo-hydrolase [Alistipes sp.]